ncbi:MAG: hypothetical protein EPO64_02760 [Nitrospirae bacterium]|nr:MAG: hypothetical protein EPO64_02760 [Nitrospirota bacterium]
MGLNVDLLESSFKLVAPQGDKLVARFYERLFQKYPAVKPLVEQSASACQGLVGQSQRLKRLMESFKMKDGKVAEMTAIEEQAEEIPVAKAEVTVAKRPGPPAPGQHPQAAQRRTASAAPIKVGAGVGKHEGNGHRGDANEFEEF